MRTSVVVITWLQQRSLIPLLGLVYLVITAGAAWLWLPDVAPRFVMAYSPWIDPAVRARLHVTPEEAHDTPMSPEDVALITLYDRKLIAWGEAVEPIRNHWLSRSDGQRQLAFGIMPIRVPEAYGFSRLEIPLDWEHYCVSCQTIHGDGPTWFHIRVGTWAGDLHPPDRSALAQYQQRMDVIAARAKTYQPPGSDAPIAKVIIELRVDRTVPVEIVSALIWAAEHRTFHQRSPPDDPEDLSHQAIAIRTFCLTTSVPRSTPSSERMMWLADPRAVPTHRIRISPGMASSSPEVIDVACDQLPPDRITAPLGSTQRLTAISDALMTHCPAGNADLEPVVVTIEAHSIIAWSDVVSVIDAVHRAAGWRAIVTVTGQLPMVP